ncbi:extracellular catalytic domain type 1 short-chain-length polyhydroxyalkanoate depolymerase [Variovorax terrae]|uniref:PHB depolymerase family esterase n=1 Tax=Variovorax terrae TaxID=2923278 RepID=A0A9X1VUN9_9BURK|nr:PHB depolymerase family esterase [Variovorax terrae]MCJ0763260.1 PHB depolymerase family esterase [Variovorax terrae]
MAYRILRRLAAGLLASLCLFIAWPAAAGQWTFDLYGNIWGTREFQTWVPTNYRAGTPVPVVLMIHGCLSDPNSMAAVSRFNELADRENFIVVYPRQNATANPQRCWNFMFSFNQSRGSGEPSILMGIVNKVKSRYSVDNSRVYVTGISSGGAMTSIMAACYSDVFAAGAVHSGGMYKGGVGLVTSAESLLLGSPYDPDVRGRDAWQCSGSPRRLMPMLVFHGTDDIVVNPVNGEQTVQQFVQTNDLGDDGLDNDSARYVASSINSYTTPVPGGRNYTVATYKNNAGVTVAQKYTVEGMNHAWSGGPPLWPFSDELGPDATGISWAFFKNYQR